MSAKKQKDQEMRSGCLCRRAGAQEQSPVTKDNGAIVQFAFYYKHSY